MDDFISSNNQTRADNQQGRLDPNWVVGFVDGEGCFSVSILKNMTTTSGYQIFPEFVVTQGAKSLSVLEDLQQFFNCGKIHVNHRKDNHKEDLYRYCVRSIRDISLKIVPFFDQNQLRTAKYQDFLVFRQVMEVIAQRKHIVTAGVDEIRILAATMNRRKIRN
jgi:hypothetical protein